MLSACSVTNCKTDTHVLGLSSTMKLRRFLALAMLSLPPLSAATTPATPPPDDPYLWLEDVEGAKPLEWVEAQNKVSLAELTAAPGYQALYDRLLAINDSRARIPAVVKRGAFYYNFWQDKTNPRGLWRRTTPEDYRNDNPKWETVLDLDALARDEKQNWVWSAPVPLYPDYDRYLLRLSRGGGDATVVREFDLATKTFVKAQPFDLPEARTASRGSTATPSSSAPISAPAHSPIPVIRAP